MQYDAELIKGCKNDLMQACIAMLIIPSQQELPIPQNAFKYF